MSGIEGRGRKQPGAKSAEGPPTMPQGAKAKKPKTGGRKKSSLEEEMARARIASEIAGWPDDTTLNEDLALTHQNCYPVLTCCLTCVFQRSWTPISG